VFLRDLHASQSLSSATPARPRPLPTAPSLGPRLPRSLAEIGARPFLILSRQLTLALSLPRPANVERSPPVRCDQLAVRLAICAPASARSDRRNHPSGHFSIEHSPSASPTSANSSRMIASTAPDARRGRLSHRRLRIDSFWPPWAAQFLLLCFGARISCCTISFVAWNTGFPRTATRMQPAAASVWAASGLSGAAVINSVYVIYSRFGISVSDVPDPDKESEADRQVRIRTGVRKVPRPVPLLSRGSRPSWKTLDRRRHPMNSKKGRAGERLGVGSLTYGRMGRGKRVPLARCPLVPPGCIIISPMDNSFCPARPASLKKNKNRNPPRIASTFLRLHFSIVFERVVQTCREPAQHCVNPRISPDARHAARRTLPSPR